MLHHLSLNVRDVEAAKAFYSQALAPLGIQVVVTIPVEYTGEHPAYGFGRGPKPDLWIGQSSRHPVTTRLHLALRAQSRDEVDAFHAAALAAGAQDNGAPGPRPMYHPNYYAAFVIDSEGHNLEAVHDG